MKTRYIKLADTFDNEDIMPAVNIIKQGGLVAFPTETVYGLGADATNPEAAKKIYAAKGRPSDNPLIIHISKPEDAEKYTYTNEVYYKLAQSFMPGPITVVLPAKDTVPINTRGGLDTVAVRCPSNPIASRLIALAGVPIAAPSANLSGSPSPTCFAHVRDDMDGRVDMIIEAQSCDIGLESTIVACDNDGALTLLRPGKITLEELSLMFPDIKLASAVTGTLKIGEKVLSPGMKYKHYAPKTPLVLLDSTPVLAFEYIYGYRNKNNAVICYDEDEMMFLQIPNLSVYKFGKSSDTASQARKLFTMLRDIDNCGYDAIYAPLPSKKGMGLALYNRMIRASGYTVIKLR